MEKCYVSIVTNNYYLEGLKVLSCSLHKTKPSYDLVVVIPEDADSFFEEACRNVRYVTNVVRLPRVVFDLDYDFDERFNHLKDTFFKLSVVSLIDYKKIILLDTDLLVLKNIDSLFDFPHMAATRCGSIGHPEWKGVLLNSGLLVLEPNLELYKKLVEIAKELVIENQKEHGPIGDQDVFCKAYPTWNECEELQIPEEYNEYYLYAGKLAKTLKHGWKDIKVLHYWGKEKPWSKTPFQLLIQSIKFLRNRRKDLAKSFMLYRKYLIISKKVNKN